MRFVDISSRAHIMTDGFCLPGTMDEIVETLVQHGVVC